MTNFTPNKNLDIINYNYKAFIDEKVIIDSYNSAAEKSNIKTKRHRIVYSIISVVLIAALTIVLCLLSWAVIRTNPIFETNPLRTPLILIVVVAFVVAGTLASILLCKFIAIKYNNRLKEKREYSEQILFSLKAETGKLANVRIMEPENKTPYIEYPTMLSFDSLSADGAVSANYQSTEGSWKIIFIPTIFGTVINCETLTIHAPYEPNAASCEAAYKNEKRRRETVESEYREYKKIVQVDKIKSDGEKAKLISDLSRITREGEQKDKLIRELQEEVKTTSSAIEASEAIHATSLKELKDSHEFEIYTLKASHDAQVDNYEGKIAELKETIENITSDLNQSETDKLALEHELKTSNSYYTARKNEFDRMQSSYLDLQEKAAQCDELVKANNSMNRLLRDQKDELALLRERNQLLEMQRSTLDEEYKKAQTELSELRKKKNSDSGLETRYDKQVRENFRLSKQIEALEAQLGLR